MLMKFKCEVFKISDCPSCTVLRIERKKALLKVDVVSTRGEMETRATERQGKENSWIKNPRHAIDQETATDNRRERKERERETAADGEEQGVKEEGPS